MTDWIMKTIAALGYPGVAALMFLENLFPPIPSEVVMPLAAAALTRDGESLLLVIVAGTIGSVLGTLPLYWIGRRTGKERLRAWVERHGCWVGLSCEDLDRAHAWFERRGVTAVFIGRLLPGVRSLISLPAGVARMSFPLFLACSLLGAAVWTALLALAGHLLGANYRLIERFLDPIAWLLFGVILVAYIRRVVRRYRGERRQERAAA